VWWRSELLLERGWVSPSKHNCLSNVIY